MRYVLMRRLAVMLAVVGAFFLSFALEKVYAQDYSPPVRKSISDLTPAELMSLRKGVATMMSRNTAGRTTSKFRRSWIYWANIHGHFGDPCIAGPIVGNGMGGLKLWNPLNPTEVSTWCKCEHNTPQFLTWHRMYMYYFEQVLRQASGDPKLTLPYWDYGVDRQLPAALRAKTYVNEKGKTVRNPLRVEARRATLNAGTGKLAATTVSSTNAMSATTFATFSTRLEASPHAAVHCAIVDGGCPNGLMGAVPVAANDPIFYFHHTNIDRLYECWLQVDEAGRLPTDQAILDQRYTFIQGDGTAKERQVRDMLTTAQLGYTYAAGGSGCPTPAQSVAPLAAATAMTQIAQAAQATLTSAAQAAAPMGSMTMADGTELKRGTTELPIAIDESPATTTVAPTARSTASATASPKSAILTIEGVNAKVVPGALYNVYLANDAGKRQQVGIISFFGFGGPATGGKHDHGMGARNFEFDATDAVRKLGLTGSKKPKLIFEPTTGLDDSTPAKAAGDIPANAKVTFQKARLKVKP